LLRALGGTLGILQSDPTAFLQGSSKGGPASLAALDETAIQVAIAARAAAKASKDFAEADRIRNMLLEQGVVLKDSATGTTWERN
jgi:cysteinyl-tRNA synthetase